MNERPFWVERIEVTWREAPIVCLAGVRRDGKTTLVKSLGDRILYINCDHGLLWEHMVLEYLQVHDAKEPIQYWRDADGWEIDFVILRSRDEVDTIECKWSVDHFEPKSLKKFRTVYPGGRNYLICPISSPGYPRRVSGMDLYVCNPRGWHEHLSGKGSRKSVR